MVSGAVLLGGFEGVRLFSGIDRPAGIALPEQAGGRGGISDATDGQACRSNRLLRRYCMHCDALLGQMNDARCNLALALTAIQQGAIVTNYTEVVSLLKDANFRLTGAMLNDRLSGTSFPVYARGIINATGPYCDHIRFMDNPEEMPIVIPSAGSHIVLPEYYSPASMGLIDPKTSDGRVIFFLPWEGNTIAGTTDAPTELSYEPRANPRDIDFILAEIKAYLGPQIKVDPFILKTFRCGRRMCLQPGLASGP